MTEHVSAPYEWGVLNNTVGLVCRVGGGGGGVGGGSQEGLWRVGS